MKEEQGLVLVHPYLSGVNIQSPILVGKYIL